MANLGIVGYGIVGQATEYGFKDKHTILKYDKFKDLDSLEKVVKESEFIFICLPTPFKGEKIDLKIIHENLEKISKFAGGTDKIVVIKSTVVPGTTKELAKKYPGLNFCANPEFLTEANYLEDFKNADRTIVGADDPTTAERVSALYKATFPDIPIFETDLTSAEMVKYTSNAFLATKVTFANEMFQLCEKLGIDYHKVKDMVVADHRIFDGHLDVTPARGFGGKCFPKDIVALIGRFKELGVDPLLIETAWRKNLQVRKVRDWEDIPFVKSD